MKTDKDKNIGFGFSSVFYLSASVANLNLSFHRGVRRLLVESLMLTAMFGSAACYPNPKATPKVALLDGAYYLIPLNGTVRIQRHPDWSIRVDAIDPKLKSCVIEVISAEVATPNVATLQLDEALPDIPGPGHKPTGAVVQIRDNTVKVWANTQ
jgi:hypothetical protein